LPQNVGDVIGAESASGGGLLDGAGHGIRTVLGARPPGGGPELGQFGFESFGSKGLAAAPRTLSRFAVQSPIGDLIEPLARLAVHIVEVEEIAQRPEVLPDVTDDAAFHFTLLPATRLIAGARVTVELAGKGQEARIEAGLSLPMSILRKT
jgi:hypothetical protein